MEEARRCTLRERAKMVDLMRTTADIKE